jgi:chromosome partitioning protein
MTDYGVRSSLLERKPCTVSLMQTYAIVNQKGGVGKTTLTLNLCAALAELGLRVLLVDEDPQGYATAGSGHLEDYDREGVTFASFLLGDIPPEGVTAIIKTTKDGYDLLPSNLDMFTSEQLLSAQRGREYRLSQILEAIDKNYDFALIDCPPSLGVLTDNAIVAARRVIVPMLPDGLSIRALELLLDQIESIRSQLGVEVALSGVVLNQYSDTLAAKRVDQDLAALPEIRVLARIRKRVSTTNSWEAGRSVLSTDPKGHVAESVRDIAKILAAEVA